MNEIFVDMSGLENISETGYGGHLLPKVDHDTHRKEEQSSQRPIKNGQDWAPIV